MDENKRTNNTPSQDEGFTIKQQYPELYRKVQNDPKARAKLFKTTTDEENRYRELFAQERDSPELDNPNVLLLNPHEHEDIFQFIEESEEESKIPRISTLDTPKKGPSDKCIVNKHEFLTNFRFFTEGQLENLDWNNVIVAGGSVLACLQPNNAKNNKERREYFHKDAYKNSDIDMFIYGLDPAAANEKLQHIYDTIAESIIGGEDVIAFRSQHAVTIVSKFPYRHTQIILRLYKSPAEILMGFDVDACAVGFNGTDVIMSPRAHHALTYQLNTVDMTRRSPSYEIRLSKYCQRGFSVLVPSLDESRIDPQLFEKRFDQVQGLAKLILITKLEDPTYRYAYKEQQRMRKLRPEPTHAPSFLARLCPRMDQQDAEYNAERLGGASASDYSTVFLPWGPKWDAQKTRRLMYTKDMMLNSKWYDPNKKYHTHPCFFGTVQEILGDCCGQCPPIPEEDIDPDSPYVSGPLTWLTINPGQQTQLKRIGSFHPITEGDWTEGAYISAEIEELSSVVNTNQHERLEEMLAKNPALDVNRRDSSGRVALHIASFVNAVECAKILIAHNARISSPMPDGRNALHICAQYGHHEIISLLIQRGAELKREAELKKTDDEKGDQNETNDDQDDGFSIRKVIERKKKEMEESSLSQMEKSEREADKLEVDSVDWDYRWTALEYAAFFGQAEAIRVLIVDGGANPNRLHETCKVTSMMLAIAGNHLGAVKALLRHGYQADLKVQDSFLSQCETAITYACYLVRTSIVKLLLENGADLNQQTKHNQLLIHIALDAPTRTDDDDDDDDDDALPYTRQKPKKKTTQENGYQFQKTVYLRRGRGVRMYPCYGPLHDAHQDTLPTKEEKLELIRFLLERGCPAQILPPSPSDSENSKTKESSVQQSIIVTGPFFSSSQRQEQPIFIALNEKNSEFLSLLIEFKADVNSIRVDSRRSGPATPLDTLEEKIEAVRQELGSDLLRGPLFGYTSLVSDSWKEKLVDEFSTRIDPLQQLSAQHSESPVHQKIISFELSRLKRTFESSFLIGGDEEQSLEPKKKKRTGSSPFDAHCISSDEYRSKKQQRLLRELESLEKKFDLLLKHGAKFFHELPSLKGTPWDELEAERLSRQQDPELDERGWKNPRRGRRAVFITQERRTEVTFSPIQPVIPELRNGYVRYRNQNVPAGVHEKLFNAVLNRDLSELDQATIKQPIGKQAHVCSWVALNDPNYGETYRNSPLFFAVRENHPDLIRRLLEIAQEQFTPLAPRNDSRDREFIPTINNRVLTSWMNLGLSPGMYLDQSGMSLFTEECKPLDVDPSLLVRLNCLTSLSQLLTWTTKMAFRTGNATWNVVEYAAYLNAKESLQEILEFVLAHKVPYIAVDSRDASPDALVAQLIRPAGRESALHLAIAKGHLEIAEALVSSYGAVYERPEEELAASEPYSGLDVGGRKIDWALEHRRYDPNAIPRIPALMIAAAFNRADAVEFLLTRGEALWKSHFRKTHGSDQELPACPADFAPGHLHKSAHSPLHVCAHANASHAAETLLRLTESRYIEQQTNNGLTALMIAAMQGNLEMMRVLAKRGANVAAVCGSHRGWTPLHYAVHGGHELAVEFLLEKLTPAQANAKSALYLQTPLMLAMKRNSDKVDRTCVVQALLRSGKVDPFVRDSGGDFALHHAVREKNFSAVEMLLPAFERRYAQESGISQTVLDTSVLSLIQDFVQAQGAQAPCDASVVFKHVSEKMGRERSLAEHETIQSVTRILLERAIVSSLAKNKRRGNWHYRNEHAKASTFFEDPPRDEKLDSGLVAFIMKVVELDVIHNPLETQFKDFNPRSYVLVSDKMIK